MPIYNYKCDGCGKEFEYKQSINDKPLEFCPSNISGTESTCNGKVRRIISKNIGFVFNGSGFYITDYTNKSKEKATTTNTCSSNNCGCNN